MLEQIQENINKFVDTFPNPQIRKICFVYSFQLLQFCMLKTPEYSSLV